MPGYVVPCIHVDAFVNEVLNTDNRIKALTAKIEELGNEIEVKKNAVLHDLNGSFEVNKQSGNVEIIQLETTLSDLKKQRRQLTHDSLRAFIIFCLKSFKTVLISI